MMSKLLTLFLLLSTAVWAQPAYDYPPDPEGSLVDRARETVWGNTPVTFYAVIYNRGEQGYLDLYKGGPWKKIQSIKIEFEGDSVKIPEPSVLLMRHEENKIHMSWETFVGYREGAVSLHYIYDRATGKMEMIWSD